MFSRKQLTYNACALPDRATMSDDAKPFFERMKQRHSVWDYTDQAFTGEIIEACIRTAGSAKSGANHQPWHFAAISAP